MKNYLFLLFFALFTINNAQTDLARFNNTNYKPTLLNTNIIVGDVTGKNVNLGLGSNWYTPTGAGLSAGNYNTFETSSWPTPATGTVDYNKYIQFTIGPKAGYKLTLSEFNIICGANGPGTLRVDYSLYEDFSNPTTLLKPTVINGHGLHTLTGFASPLATSGQIVYVRVYFYNTNQTFRILFQDGKNIGPIFKGAVTPISLVPFANHDTAVTNVNNDTDIDALRNDDYVSNLATTITITSPPSHGSVSINNDNTLNYVPTAGYFGNDVISYTISNIHGVSNIANVNITVNPQTTTTLIQWDSASNTFYPTSYQSFISSNTPVTTQGLSLATATWSTPRYQFGNVDKSPAVLNTSKYVQFVLNNTSSRKTIELQSFEYIGHGTNEGNFEIRYSKQNDFSNFSVLASGTYTSTVETRSFNFIPKFTVEPGEILYIRLYVYNSNSDYYIQYNSGSMGPAVKGFFYNYVYSPNETVWKVNPSTQLPYWDNGIPTATKNARIATYYNTSNQGRGNFESKNLTIDAGTGLVIASGNNVTVNGRIINSGNETNFIIENDANLLQNTNAQNTGIATVKKEAIIPKMGYNYWSSPVDDQNLYQFSAGYNQAVAANYDPNGTPWNRFYVYRESNDYFVTSVPGEITLSATSSFDKARGYAIRGKNNFDVSITNSTPVANFEFVGTLRNGDISSYPLKWTDANHGFNMIGNPYPSNMDFEDFHDLNRTKIKAVAYFWTNNDGKFASQQSSNYGGNNYATINGGGGVSATYIGNTRKRPTGSISVGQGFIIQAIQGGKNETLTFNNNLRTSSAANYYNKTMAQKNRFWLEFKSPTDVNNEILIGYINNATNDFDTDYDADLLAVGSDSFWTVLDNHKLAIQSKNPNFNKEDVTKVGYKASVSGNFTISVTDRNGIFDSSQSVYLRDKQLNKVVSITNEPYVFYTNSGQYEDRFEIVYKPLETLGTDNLLKNGIQIYKDVQNFIVKSSDNLDEVSVYDAVGRLVYDSKASKKEILINKSNFAEGLYIIKTRSGNTIITKKVLK